jgi:hypothetical protein
MIEHSFRVGRYRCVARYTGPVPVPVSMDILLAEIEWTPDVPDWEALTPAERRAYEEAGETFEAKVRKASLQ